LDIFLDPVDLGTNCVQGSPLDGVWDAAPNVPKVPTWVPATKAAVFDKATAFLKKEEAVPKHPYWPGGSSSGVTWGVGWDAGGRSADEIRSTWKALKKEDLDKLATCAGLKGAMAQAKAAAVKDVTIPQDVSIDVFKSDSLPTYYAIALNTFPGMNKLPVGTQVALVSLVYNRGGNTGKDKKDKHGDIIMDRRFEMRRIRDAVAEQDLQEIARLLRQMERLWKGKDIEKGMNARREHEAALVELDMLVKTQPLKADTPDF